MGNGERTAGQRMTLGIDLQNSVLVSFCIQRPFLDRMDSTSDIFLPSVLFSYLFLTKADFSFLKF